MKTRYLLWLVVAWCFVIIKAPVCLAQPTYFSSSPVKNNFDKKKWAHVKKDYAYSGKAPEEKKQPVEKPSKPEIQKSTSWYSSSAWKYILMCLVIGVLVFVIVRLGIGMKIIENTKVKPREYTLKELEENLPEHNIQTPLEKALAAKDYKLAVRLYYLLVIQQLSGRNIIRWRREKTNSEYLMEAFRNPCYPLFRSVTISFDRIWYGEKEITEQGFMQLSRQFDELLNGIKQAA